MLTESYRIGARRAELEERLETLCRNGMGVTIKGEPQTTMPIVDHYAALEREAKASIILELGRTGKPEGFANSLAYKAGYALWRN